MKENKSRSAGYRAYCEGVPKHRNPFQYSSDIFKQAFWVTGWNEAEKEGRIFPCQTGLKAKEER